VPNGIKSGVGLGLSYTGEIGTKVGQLKELTMEANYFRGNQVKNPK